MKTIGNKAREKISVILPVYNERGNIVPLVEAVGRLLQDREHEIVIVDDHSCDGTFEAARCVSCGSVRVFSSQKRLGLAVSIRHGLIFAEGESVVIMDSDFNHKPEYLPFMIDALSDHDCVIASRFLPGGSMDNRLRYCLSALFNFFLRRFTPLKVSDSLYGFLAVKKSILENFCYDDIFYGHGDYCMRLLCCLQSINARFFEFPAVSGRRRSGRRKMNFVTMMWRYVSAACALNKKVEPARA